jgi:prefoldin subunit 5
MIRRFSFAKSSSTAISTVEALKLQHAEELAIVNEEHARQMSEMQHELDRCREEIDALRAMSEEHCDTLMPLGDPSKSLKFVKNTGHKSRKLVANNNNSSSNATIRDKSVISQVAGMKQQHRKDLAKAAEIYARKLHALKKDVEKYKKEVEMVQQQSSTSVIDDGPPSREECNDVDGVNVKTGVAQHDKENNMSISSSKRASKKCTHDSKLIKQGQESIQQNEDIINHTSRNTTASKDTVTNENLIELLNDPYERLFLDDYQYEQDQGYEEIFKYQDTQSDSTICDLCQEMIKFMDDARAKSLSPPTTEI